MDRITPENQGAANAYCVNKCGERPRGAVEFAPLSRFKCQSASSEFRVCAIDEYIESLSIQSAKDAEIERLRAERDEWKAAGLLAALQLVHLCNSFLILIEALPNDTKVALQKLGAWQDPDCEKRIAPLSQGSD